jgi:hypothetical protein
LKASNPLRIFLLVCALASASLFTLTLLHAKELFNPSDWLSRLIADERLIVLKTWDMELFRCPDRTFDASRCESLSGAVIFEDTALPLQNSIQSRFGEWGQRSTHMRLRHVLSLSNQDWVSNRWTEEYLFPTLILFKNHRCFEASGTEPYCGQRTEIISLKETLSNGTLNLIFHIDGASSFGPQVLPPMIVESNLIPRVIAIDDKATAAFTTEGILLVTVMVFFAALSLLFPWHAPVVVMFLLCLFKALQSTLGYVYENQVVDWFYWAFGSTGYLPASIILNAIVLGLLLYLSVVIMRQGYALSRLEVGYGTALIGVFIGLGVVYGQVGELATASLFTRDAIATLFGAIWIMYHLLMEWHISNEAGVESTARSGTLKTFLYLFFLVAYGAAGAQTAMGTTIIPDLLPWQSLFFIPGIGLAVLIDLADKIERQRKGSLEVSGGVDIQREQNVGGKV